VELLVSPSGFHQDLGRIIQQSLAECGIEVEIVTSDPEVLYAPGPGGPLFGRDFDLALISWQPMPDLDCRFYMSEGVPGSNNQWIGTNIAGWADEAYDQACSTAALALPEDTEQAMHTAEAAFLKALPAVPLVSATKLMVISNTGCPLQSVTSEGDFFAHLEYYPWDQACP
jgi:peptide/nickel transport system substrate-binding protein